MNTDTYEETNTDLDVDMELDFDENLLLSTGIAGFEIAYATSNKEAIKKANKRSAKQKYLTRQKLDSIREKRSIERELNSFSDYWDM